MHSLGISCRRVGFRCCEEDSYRFSAVSIFPHQFPFCQYHHWQKRKRHHPLLASTMAIVWLPLYIFFSFLYDYDCPQCLALLAEGLSVRLFKGKLLKKQYHGFKAIDCNHCKGVQFALYLFLMQCILVYNYGVLSLLWSPNFQEDMRSILKTL